MFINVGGSSGAQSVVVIHHSDRQADGKSSSRVSILINCPPYLSYLTSSAKLNTDKEKGFAGQA